MKSIKSKLPFLNDLTIEQLKNWANEFHKNYRFDSSFYAKAKNLYFLGNKNFKICRYCGKNEIETSFRKKAHIIPKVIGNIHVACYYECDSCNELFGVYETSLANFIGIRGFIESKENYGVKRSRVYRSHSGKSYIYMSKRGIEISDLEQEIFDTVDDNKALKCKVNKYPFVPLHVYKALVKMVISVLKEEALKDYKQTLSFLANTGFDDHINVKEFSIVSINTVSEMNVEFPIIFIYRKNENLLKYEIEENFLIPDKTFLIYFKQFCYQVFVVFDSNDSRIKLKIPYKITFPLAPPMLFNSNYSDGCLFPQYYNELRELKSLDKVHNEKDEFYIVNKVKPIKLTYSDKERKELIRRHNLRK